MQSTVIRKTFLDFFHEKGHEILPSASIVVKDDPTLMFTNAGMNQFKDVFLGHSSPCHPRVANTQKCLRVSGKHNDLEQVGVDAYHHTMFEMLGNWSFGDYFKNDAIAWAWELLTKVYRLPADRLYVTVFSGDDSTELPPDVESRQIWKELIPEDRILSFGAGDNFWEMGNTGPCGPCSEIHIDLRSDTERRKVNATALINRSHPLVMELWNLVFIEYNRMEDSRLIPLPQKHVDTGMGFERLCMAMQKKTSSYETDLFLPLLQGVEDISGKQYGKEEKTDIAFRAITDHLRAVSFTIADGQLPFRDGAGYVVRRILRRAVRYGYSLLARREPFIHQLVPTLTEQLGKQFPELLSNQTLIEKVIFEEEENFLRTLEKGLKKFESATDRIDGKFAFELYDTFGFPVDLTCLLARERNMEMDMDGFHREMEKQKQRARKATAVDAGDWMIVLPELADKNTEFVGYDFLEAEARLIKYRKIKIKGKEQFQLVFDKTPFYAESGGQVGDTGTAVAGEEARIGDVRKEGNLIVHFTNVPVNNPGARFHLRVDAVKRRHTANNHSATHLLHHALRTALGKHVEQKGSLVHPDYLRFDFTHFQKVSDEELSRIEAMVNEKIRENSSLEEQRSMPLNEAKKMGAMALFGEKYGERVRMVRFGESVELCGGTHVPATGQIGLFKITSEGAIAAGIRRIEAVTAAKSEEYVNQKISELREIQHLLKTPENAAKQLKELLEQHASLSKQVEKFTATRVGVLLEELKKSAEMSNGIHIITRIVELDSTDAVKLLAFRIKSEMDNLFLALGAKINGKAHLTVVISDNLLKENGLNATEIIRESAREIGGGGGGQPFYATAGGNEVGGLQRALQKAVEMVKAKL